MKKLWFEDQHQLHVQEEISQFLFDFPQQHSEERSLHSKNKQKKHIKNNHSINLNIQINQKDKR